MKTLFVMLIAAWLLVSVPGHAADTAVSADAQVQAEGNFFTRSWASIKGFFQGEKTPADSPAQDDANAATEVETESDKSLIDKAAESTKRGVGWTAEKAKQGAEWTKETAKGAAKATSKGMQKVGETVSEKVDDLFPSANDTQVDTEASLDADVELETE